MPKHTVKARFERKQRQLFAGEVDVEALHEVMNVADVAAFLEVKVSTVQQNVRRYRIPHRRLGKYYLFTRGAIVEWLARPIVEPPPNLI